MGVMLVALVDFLVNRGHLDGGRQQEQPELGLLTRESTSSSIPLFLGISFHGQHQVLQD